MERRDIPAFVTVCVVTLAVMAWTWHQHQRPMELPRYIEFTGPIASDVRLIGFSHQESSGRWTIGHNPGIRFLHALPAGFKLKMRIKGFGPNIGQSIRVKCGAVTRRIVVGEDMSTAEIDFSRVGAQNHLIEIEVPFPASPAQLRISADQRLLGVGIESLAFFSVQ